MAVEVPTDGGRALQVQAVLVVRRANLDGDAVAGLLHEIDGPVHGLFGVVVVLIPLALVNLVRLTEDLLLVLLDGHAGVALLLEGLAVHGVVRAAAARGLRGSGHDDGVDARFGRAVRRHEAGGAAPHHHELGFDGFLDVRVRNGLGRNFEGPLALRCGRGVVRFAFGRTGACSRRVLVFLARGRARRQRGGAHRADGRDGRALEEVPAIEFHGSAPFRAKIAPPSGASPLGNDSHGSPAPTAGASPTKGAPAQTRNWPLSGDGRIPWTRRGDDCFT